MSKNVRSSIKEQLNYSIDLLRQRVNENLDIIHKNEALVRNILSNEPVSMERSKKLEEKFNENKKMLEENHDAINLQLSIIQFLSKYKETKPIAIQVINPSDNIPEDLFEQTINGKIEFNQQHPLYHDEEFFNKLLQHFTDIEDYETCSKLMKLKPNKR